MESNVPPKQIRSPRARESTSNEDTYSSPLYGSDTSEPSEIPDISRRIRTSSLSIHNQSHIPGPIESIPDPLQGDSGIKRRRRKPPTKPKAEAKPKTMPEAKSHATNPAIRRMLDHQPNLRQNRPNELKLLELERRRRVAISACT